MKAQEFETIKANVNEYVGKLVKFEHYIPSAYRMKTSTGYIVGVGEEVFKEYIIIKFAGEVAIHYKDVEILTDKPTIKEEMNTITITSEFAHKVALALVNDYNRCQGQQIGSVRLVAFRSLYQDLKTLGEQFLISSAIHPEDYPQEMWFV